MKEIAAA